MIVEAIILGGAIITVGVFVPSIRFARYILDREDKNAPKEPKIPYDPLDAKLFAIDQQIKIAQAHLDSSLHNSLDPNADGVFDLAIEKARKTIDGLAADKAAIIAEKEKIEKQRAEERAKQEELSMKNAPKPVIYPWLHPGSNSSSKAACPLCGTLPDAASGHGIYKVPTICPDGKNCPAYPEQHLHCHCCSCRANLYTSFKEQPRQ